MEADADATELQGDEAACGECTGKGKSQKTSPEKVALQQPHLLDSDVGYHVREGGHSIEMYDWQRFMDFADRHLKKR